MYSVGFMYPFTRFIFFKSSCRSEWYFFLNQTWGTFKSEEIGGDVALPTSVVLEIKYHDEFSDKKVLIIIKPT